MKSALAARALVAASLGIAAHAFAQTAGQSGDSPANPAAAPQTDASAAVDSPAPTSPSPTEPTTSAAPATGELTPAQLAVWDSPEMIEARAWVMEYGRRSRQFNESAARAYLERVRRLSPEGMANWLRQLNARRAASVQSNDIANAARQRAIASAYARLQAMQQAHDNVSLGQTQAAQTARDQLESQQQRADDELAIRRAGRSDYLWDMYYGRNYYRLAFPDYRTRVAAAMSLPGNLPPGDPNNFIRGDVPGPGSANVDANGVAIPPSAGP
jgi:hypothetical protein